MLMFSLGIPVAYLMSTLSLIPATGGKHNTLHTVNYFNSFSWRDEQITVMVSKTYYLTFRLL